MARILASTTPARGHLYPLTPVLDELGRRGHQIALRTLGSAVPTMRARGFDAAPVSDRIEAIAHDDWRAGNPRAALARAVRIFIQRAQRDGPDLARAIDRSGRTRCWSTSTRGAPSRRPRPGRPLGELLPLAAAAALSGRAAVRAGAAAGAGTRLPARRLRPDRLRAEVHEAIQLREGARRIQQAFTAAGGPTADDDAFETRLLKGSYHRSSHPDRTSHLRQATGAPAADRDVSR